MKLKKINKEQLLQNKGATIGVIWAVLSMIGYAIFYPQIGGQSQSLIYRFIFFFVSLLDKIESAINPNFSLTYTIVYTYRANVLLFLFILVIGGVVGGIFGAGAEYLINRSGDYLDEHQEPTMKKVKEIIHKIKGKIEKIINDTREKIKEKQKENK